MPTSLEAMAFGMSVVTTPMGGGTKDFFEGGLMGYLCNSTQPEKIVQKLKKVICDKESLCNHAIYNYHFAKKNFMASKVV